MLFLYLWYKEESFLTKMSQLELGSLNGLRFSEILTDFEVVLLYFFKGMIFYYILRNTLPKGIGQGR